MKSLINKEDLPREKAIKYGINNLSDYELIAIILDTGTKDYDVLELARMLSSSFNPLSRMTDTTLEELTNFKGIGRAKALKLLASLEIGKRCLKPEIHKVLIKSALDIYNYTFPILFNLKQETLLAVFLNSKGMVIRDKVITIGSINRTILDPRDIVGYALKINSYIIFIAHNHPSGDATPSVEDDATTKELAIVCKNTKIKLLDHIIIGSGEFYSYGNGGKYYIGN